eukprot:scaffold22558_cov116-Cylindrotheca_fusiformis.AAC.3
MSTCCVNETTIGSDMSQAIMLNNIVTPCMQHGEYRQSIRKLSTALKLIRMETIQSCAESNGLKNASHGFEIALVRHMSNFLCNSSSFARRKDGFQMFVGAISIPQQAPATSRSCELVALTVMFNLALSHQLLALQLSGKESLLYLGKALRLYQLCCQVQILTESDLQRSLLPAIISNMGIAQFKMQREEEAKKSFEWILSISVFSNAYYWCDGEVHHMNQNTSIFLENAFHVLHKRSVPASAA